MIADILFYVCIPTVGLIGLIGTLYYFLMVRPMRASQNDPDDYDDDDYGDGDDDYDPDIELESHAYPQLDEVHMMAYHLWGNDATEYTVEHVRKLLEMEKDVETFMDDQDVEVWEYLQQMDIAA